MSRVPEKINPEEELSKSFHKLVIDLKLGEKTNKFEEALEYTRLEACDLGLQVEFEKFLYDLDHLLITFQNCYRI